MIAPFSAVDTPNQSHAQGEKVQRLKKKNRSK
jgi:hypothetical protein